MIDQGKLRKLYEKEGKSMKEIADTIGCSRSKVTYWMKKYGIDRRSQSDAMYLKYNPEGDPFDFSYPKSTKEGVLFGLGLGLFWGEGSKAHKHSIRLGNTDPDLIRWFLKFLTDVCDIEHSEISFGLQIFSDINTEKALKFWLDKLKVSRSQFQKVVVTRSSKSGTYRKKIKHGVLTVYFHNVKLRRIIEEEINKLREAL